MIKKLFIEWVHAKEEFVLLHIVKYFSQIVIAGHEQH